MSTAKTARRTMTVGHLLDTLMMADRDVLVFINTDGKPAPVVSVEVNADPFEGPPELGYRTWLPGTMTVLISAEEPKP